MRVGIVLASTVVLMLSACGGGGGNPGTCMASALTCARVSGGGSPGNPAPGSPPAGLYRGTTADGRAVAAVVRRESSATWVIYTAAGSTTLIAGAQQGTAAFANGTFSIADLRDFSVERKAVSSGTMTGTYVANSTLAGTATFSASSVAFTASYDVASTQAPALFTIAGLYSGTAATLAGTESTTFTIAQDGTLAGSSPSGCRFSGTAALEPGINAYAVSVTFQGGTCSNANSTVSGVAYYDAGVRRITAAALNADRSNGFILAAGK